MRMAEIPSQDLRTLLTLESFTQNAEVAVDLTRQARRELLIWTRDLDPPLYDQAPFLEAVQALALRSRFSVICILLQDNQQVREYGHRLVTLARRLTSRFEIRRPPADYLDHPENFLIADRHAYLHRPLASRYQASACYDAPPEALRLAAFYREVWDQSEPDSALRALML